MSVVVGYVPTTAGFQAVTEALREAQWRGTDLVVVNVVGTAGYTTPTAADDQDLDALEVRLAESGVPHTIHRLDVSAEDASDEILRLADETDAELIVVAIRRRSAVAKAILGSNAQRVLLGARCPVLAVRPTE
ncbi:universal stress protein [Angustibacter aerolatus]